MLFIYVYRKGVKKIKIKSVMALKFFNYHMLWNGVPPHPQLLRNVNGPLSMDGIATTTQIPVFIHQVHILCHPVQQLLG